MEAVRKLELLTSEAYLHTEACSPVKREYVDGHIYALAGARDKHNRVAGNIYVRFWHATREQECRVYMSDMKLYIKTDAMERFYYPDVMVCCDPEDDAELYKTRPCLIVEVLSPGTENVDRREKLFAYQQLASLEHYLIASPEERQVELYRRNEAGEWWFHEFRAEGRLKMSCPSLELTLDEIYEGLALKR